MWRDQGAVNAPAMPVGVRLPPPGPTESVGGSGTTGNDEHAGMAKLGYAGDLRSPDP